MTRVNAGVEPSELHRLHLIAEYREIPMVPSSIRRSLKTKNIETIIQNMPDKFTLNSGHIIFFSNKIKYLQNRYNLLIEEMVRRGYHLDMSRNPGFDDLPVECYGDWNETPEARILVLERIALRKSEKPYLYT